MSRHTKAGRRASFRAYCDPERAQRLWAREARRDREKVARESLRRGLGRSVLRLGVMAVAGWVADRVTSAL